MAHVQDPARDNHLWPSSCSKQVVRGWAKRDGESRDDALRVTGGTGRSLEYFTRCEARNLEHHEYWASPITEKDPTTEAKD